MKKEIKKKANECKRKQITQIKSQLRILKKSLKRMKKAKSVYYRNSKENWEIVQTETTVSKLNRALELLQTKRKKKVANKR